MGRTIGIIAFLIAAAFAVILILAIWGVPVVDFLTFARLGATGVILGFLGVLALLVFAMFFWRGNDKKLPSSSEEKARMKGGM